MNIKDLQPRQGNVDITAEVTEKGDVREFQKFGRSGKVCTATARDSTGEIKLSLWNEDAEKITVGDKVKLTNGYVNEFQGEKQLTTGKFGKIEVIGKSEHVKKETEPVESLEEQPAEEEFVEEEDVE